MPWGHTNHIRSNINRFVLKWFHYRIIYMNNQQDFISLPQFFNNNVEFALNNMGLKRLYYLNSKSLPFRGGA